MRRFTSGLDRVLASNKFFVLIVVLLVLEALWLVFTFAYPMQWDEYFHFGLIQFYSHHLSPFVYNQPHSLDKYGEVTRLPKYLYHYLMSFPYRLIVVFAHNQPTQIIILRIFNVAMFVGGLVAYRAAALRVVKSKALVHFCLLVLVLLPLSPLMAATINYDNLQFLLTGLGFYWTFRFIQAKKFEIKWLVLMLGVGLLACIVKYTFLPIFAAMILVAAWHIVRSYGKKSLSAAAKSFMSINRWGQIGLVILMVIGLGLFGERIAYNLVRYHEVTPKCTQVLPLKRCLQFSPFNYEYSTAQAFDASPAQLNGPRKFTLQMWLGKLYTQYFTTGIQLQSGKFAGSSAFTVPFITLAVAGFVGTICVIAKLWAWRKRPDIVLVVLSTLLLAVSLWLVDWGNYKRLGGPYAIQGRYLLPVVPLLFVLGAAAARDVIKWPGLRTSLAVLTVAGLLFGGGLITHIELSYNDWYWQNGTARALMDDARGGLNFINSQGTLRTD